MSNGLNTDRTVDSHSNRDLTADDPDPELDRGLMSADTEQRRDEKEEESHRGDDRMTHVPDFV